MKDYLERILRARVYDVAIETPLELALHLSSRLKNKIWLKREDLQSVFSFKLRGAYNKMASLSADDLKKGVIASSAGNHAQGVALAASRLGCRAVIVMPVTTPKMKVRLVAAHAAEVVLCGDTYDEAYKEARRLEKEQGLCFVHPFDDPDVIAGQGTVGLEILRQLSAPPTAIYIAVGGGGLIGGVSAYIKSLWPEVEIIGVEPAAAATMTRSLEVGRRIKLERIGIFADGVAVKEVGENTYSLATKYVDSMITVSTDEICAAIKDVFEDTRSILEPAGALAIAGMKADIAQRKLENSSLVAIACGANINFDRLRFVAERAELGEDREVILAVVVPERPGTLQHLCEIIGERNLTEFSYRMSDPDFAKILLGVQTSGLEDIHQVIETLKVAEYSCLDLSKNELAKRHIRYMIGGHLPEYGTSLFGGERQELIYRFEFPERPGALLQFVSELYPTWSISTFHYRNDGADVGYVVVGVLVAKSEYIEWENFLKRISYRYWDESDNQVYDLFLGKSNSK